MAQIIKDENDPFHDDFYMCSNCHSFLFSANAYCEPLKTRQTTKAKIIFEIPGDKSIPNICPKCLEALEFPKYMEIQLHVSDELTFLN